MTPFAYPDNPIVWIVVIILVTGLSIPRISEFIKDNKEEKKTKITLFVFGVILVIVMLVIIGAITMLLS